MVIWLLLSSFLCSPILAIFLPSSTVRKAMITFNHAGLSFVCRCITSSHINYCRSISLLTEADQPGIALDYANSIDLNTKPSIVASVSGAKTGLKQS